jgi:hypothetical protein
MKRNALLKHLRLHGCVLKREGRSHSLWMNPATGAVEAVPRHSEISNLLARKDLPKSVDPGTWLRVSAADRLAVVANEAINGPGCATGMMGDRINRDDG